MARARLPKLSKLYNLNKTPLAKIEKVDTATLEQILKEWSRIANARAKRLEKVDKDYSGLYQFRKGGKFGRKEAYRSRDAMLNEIKRVKNIGVRLTLPQLKKELAEVKKAYNEIIPQKEEPKQKQKKTKQEAPKIEYISYEEFRKAFAMYRASFGQVPQEVYEKVKSIVTSMSSRTLTEVYELVIRITNEELTKYYESMEDLSTPENFGDEDDLPW